jgi:hypothetical protein
MNNLRCAILNGACKHNPCDDVSSGEECPWGCKMNGKGICVNDACASHDLRMGDLTSCLNDVLNRCEYFNNRCEVDPCSVHEEINECVKDIKNTCVFNGVICSRNSCESFSTDLNMCSMNPRCVVINSECHENPCDENSCDVNLCVLSSKEKSKCIVDPCAFHKATDIECGFQDECVVKWEKTNKYCVSGGCEELNERTSCEMNSKCIYSKNICKKDECQELNYDECEKNVLCYVDDNNNCKFESCSEGTHLNDNGEICSSFSGCGYEIFDDTCKRTTAKFTTIIVGSTQGMVF